MNSDAEKIQNIRLYFHNSAQRVDFFFKNLIFDFGVYKKYNFSFLIEDLVQNTKNSTKYVNSVFFIDFHITF